MKPVTRAVYKLCKRCRGTGWRLKSASPIRFAVCTKCYGAKGKLHNPSRGLRWPNTSRPG